MTTSQEEIDAIFEEAEDQETAAVAIYTLAFPNWEKITKIEGWPACGEEVQNYLSEKVDNQGAPG